MPGGTNFSLGSGTRAFCADFCARTEDASAGFKDAITQVSAGSQISTKNSVFSNQSQTETTDLQSQAPTYYSISDGIQTTTDDELAYVISILNQY